jgi:hypothetical protein
MPDRSMSRLRRLRLRRGGGSRSSAPHTQGGRHSARGTRASSGRRVLSLVVSALMMLGTGLVTLTVVPATATAAPGTTYLAAPTPTPTGVLPDVTVHATTAPMTNLTTHTGVTRTASCPTGSLVVGGGGYLRNATDPSTVPTNGLVLGGSNP